MTLERLGLVVGCLAALGSSACGKNDHPPFTSENHRPTNAEGGAGGAPPDTLPPEAGAPPDGNATAGTDSGPAPGGGGANIPAAKGLGSLAKGMFEQDKVYMGGAFEPEMGRAIIPGFQPGRYALGRVEAPGSWMIAFDAPKSTDTHLPIRNVRFLDGHMLYLMAVMKPFGIRRWTADGSGSGPWPTANAYPLGSDNDDVVPTPKCPADNDDAAKGPQGFEVGTTGRLFYRCKDTGYFEGETPIFDGGTLLGVSQDHFFYSTGTGTFALRSIEGKDVTPVDLGGQGAGLVRALDDAFLVATTTKPQKLVRVALDGTVSEMGTYPDETYGLAMTRDGTIYGWSFFGSDDAVGRYAVGASKGEAVFEPASCFLVPVNVYIP